LNKITKKIIFFLALAAILVLPVFLLNFEPLKPKISHFILDQIKSKVNGEIIFNEPFYEIKRFKILLTAKKIQIKQAEDVVVDLENFKIVYPLRNLIRSQQIISSISADDLYIKAVKEGEFWNLEKIMKKSDKEVDFLFRSLSFHNTNLEIYSNDFYEKENVYIDIHKDKDTKLFQVHFYNNAELENSTLADFSNLSENQFYISGEYDLNNNEGVYKYVRDLKVVLSKLKPNLINLISRAFSDRKSRFITAFNNNASVDTNLSLFVEEMEEKDERYSIDLRLTELRNKENLHLSSVLDLAKDIYIDSLNMEFIEAGLVAKGTLKDAFSENPDLDLKMSLLNFNPYLYRERFPDLKSIISDKVVNFLETIHKSRVLNFDAIVKGSFHNPEFDLFLPVKNFYTSRNSTKKTFNLNMVLEDKAIWLKNLLIPFEFSDLTVNGRIFNSGELDLKLLTQDFPLRSLKPLAISLLDEEDVKVIKDISLQGYLKSDLAIKKPAKTKLPELYGSIIVAETSIAEPKIPILMQNINAELIAEKDQIKVSNFEGSLYENKVDLNGFYNIKTQEHKINVSSKEFDLDKIEAYRIDKHFPQADNFQNLKGKIENLELNSDGKIAGFASSGKLVDVSFDYIADSKRVSVHNLESGFAFYDNKLKLKNLSSYINSSSSFNFDGLIDLKGKDSNFSASAVKFPFELVSLLDLQGMPLHAHDGLLSFKANYNNEKINAEGEMNNLAFNIDSSKMPENFRAVNGDFAISEDLFLNGFSAFYGNSELKAKRFLIKDIFSDDKYYDLDIDSDLKISEFESFIPNTIAELLHMEGYLPLRLKAKGDKQKFYLDLEGDFDRVDKLVFAEWLDFDTSVKADFKSSFSFTPKLILSKNTVLNLKAKDSKTTLAADFEVHDWKEKQELRYSIDAYTPLSTNGEFIPVNLDLVEPHIKSIETLNLNPGNGTVQCRTDGSLNDRHTFCDIEFLDKTVAKNFGIGDLVSEKSSVYLISIKDKPVYIKVILLEGVWKVLEFIRVKFDMEIFGDMMNIDRIRAKLKKGFIRSNIGFNFKSLESEFKIKANNVSANQAAESFFALGHEVPQGTVSGQFEGKTKGLLPDEMFFNLEAQTSALVRDGKLSSLKTMQKLLSAVNTLKNFDFNNVFQTLITYKGGIFNDIVTYLHFDKGKITTEKLLLHSDQIELHLEGFVDYAEDYLTIRGLGAVPERSKSFLQLLGIKQVNLGNLLSIINLRNPGSKDKDYFAFSMKGPANDLTEATQSLRQNFTWLNSYGSSE
jgi:hypothetical protein